MSLMDSSSFVIIDDSNCRMYPSLPEEDSRVISSPPSLLQLASHNLSTSLPHSVYSSYAKKIQMKPDRASKSLDYPLKSIGTVLAVDDSVDSDHLLNGQVDVDAPETSILENILKGLSAENEILRKTLENSSEVMRKQLRAAQSWKQAAEVHKKSLSELEKQSLRLIQELKEENELLKEKLEKVAPDARETSVSPSAPVPESSFFWEDLSLQLQDRMDHLQLIDQMQKEKQETLTQTISELDKAKKTISQLQSEMGQSNTASELLDQLKEQVESIANVNQTEQLKNSAYEAELRSLSEKFDYLTNKTKELETKINGKDSTGGEEEKKHKHRRGHKFATRSGKSNEGEKDEKHEKHGYHGHHGHHGRLLRKLAKHSHVANLAGEIALKSVKEFKEGLKQVSQEAKK